MMADFTGRLELIDFMRPHWYRRVTATVDCVIAYVEGYADARGFGVDDSWGQIGQWIYGYLFIKPEPTWRWLRELRKHAPYPGGQIPLLYAAIDFGRAFRYRHLQIWQSSEIWRAAFNEHEEHASDRYPELKRVAPHAVVIGCAGEGAWWLFFFDRRGFRYEETRMKTEAELKAWASRHDLLKIPEDNWKAIDQDQEHLLFRAG